MKSLNLELPIVRFLDKNPESTFAAIHQNFPKQSSDTLYGILKRLRNPMDPQVVLGDGKLYRALPVLSTARVSYTASPSETYTGSDQHTREVGEDPAIYMSVMQEEEKSSNLHTDCKESDEEERISQAVDKLLKRADPDLLEGSSLRRGSVMRMLRVLVSAHPRIIMQALVRLGMKYDAPAHRSANASHNPTTPYDDRPDEIPLQTYSWATVDVQRWFQFKSRDKKRDCFGLQYLLIGSLYCVWTDLAKLIGRDFIDDLRRAVHSVQGIPAPQSPQEAEIIKYQTPANILAYNVKEAHLRTNKTRKENLSKRKKWEQELRLQFAREMEEKELEFDKAMKTTIADAASSLVTIPSKAALSVTEYEMGDKWFSILILGTDRLSS